MFKTDQQTGFVSRDGLHMEVTMCSTQKLELGVEICIYIQVYSRCGNCINIGDEMTPKKLLLIYSRVLCLLLCLFPVFPVRLLCSGLNPTSNPTTLNNVIGFSGTRQSVAVMLQGPEQCHGGAVCPLSMVRVY